MNRKIKIFVDAHCLDTVYQGTQTFVRELYSDLYHRYEDLDIYLGTSDPERISQTFSFIPRSHILSYKAFYPSIFRLFYDIPALIKKYNFHFAHFQNIAPASIATCKYIVTLHDILYTEMKQDFSRFYRYSRNWFFKKSFKSAAIKTTVSDYSLERISYYYDIPPQQISIISNSADHYLPVQAPLSKDKAIKYIRDKYGIENFILFVSRIEPRKNQLLLLDAYLHLRLQQQNITLVFIGKASIATPSFQSKLQDQLQSGEKNIFWLDQVSTKDLQAFYASCRLFVYPSKAEGFGIPPLEAALHRVPVLCSCTTAMRDYTFFDPYTFHPDSESEFINKLQSILKSPPTPEALDRIAAEITKRYSWASSAQKLYQLIRQNYTH